MAFAIKDFINGLTELQILLDRTIYALFIIDYVVRIFLAENKKLFFKANIFDLIAILPFNSAFRIFRVFKFARLLRFTKLLRIGALTVRSAKKTKKFFNTNGFKYIILLVLVIITLSTFAIMYFEGMSFPNALWWSFVTVTTVGYGDISPVTAAGRIIASLLMLTGIGLIGTLTSTITSFVLQENNKKEISTDKIEMTKTLYDKLSDEEKDIFKKMIS